MLWCKLGSFRFWNSSTGICMRNLLSIIFLFLALGCCADLRAQRASQDASPTNGPKIVVNVNNVLVPVLVRDAQGHAVGNLKKQDFQLSDEGKFRDISGFTAEDRSSIQSSSSATESATPSAKFPKSPERFIVYLFDDMHLDSGNLMAVQKAGTAMLVHSLADADLAAVISTSGKNSGLTRDRKKLQDFIEKLAAIHLFQGGVQECPNIDYYQADLIENRNDAGAIESASREALTCAHLDPQTMHDEAERMVRSAARRAMAIGEQDTRVTLDIVRECVHRMAALPGQRSIIFISPGFLTLTTEAMREKSQIMDIAAQSNVIISSLDARGLYTTNVGASERGGNSAGDLMIGSTSQNRSDSMAFSENVLSELADGTGGTYFHNSNDLEGGFRRLTIVPEYSYLLEFSLDQVKLDNKYHRLKVTIDQNGLQVQARRGYFAAKPTKNEK